MEEFLRSLNGRRLLNDIHSIAESLKIIAENINNKESEGGENESIQK